MMTRMRDDTDRKERQICQAHKDADDRDKRRIRQACKEAQPHVQAAEWASILQ
jgi:hypothetical protein